MRKDNLILWEPFQLYKLSSVPYIKKTKEVIENFLQNKIVIFIHLFFGHNFLFLHRK